MNILTINAGSSSLKASLFFSDGTRQNYYYNHLDNTDLFSYNHSFVNLLKELGSIKPDVVSHRFVHGGDINGELCDSPRYIDEVERARLGDNKQLASLHMPLSLLGVDFCQVNFNCPQIAFFDTSFHSTLPELAYRLPIPKKFKLRRYGYHGINYSHIAHRLPKLLGDAANGHIVVAHLGNGASLCLLKNLQSVDTTMGFSTAGGIPMSTRSGDLDPGVMLALAKQLKSNALTELVYKKMGLHALSDGESSDMSELLESKTEGAKFAVDFFALQVRAAIGSYAAKAGGIDGLVFTGGIGENSSHVRTLICNDLGFLGFGLDSTANKDHSATLNTSGSKPILIIPADEEAEIARLTAALHTSIILK
ncbi:MAG: acetate kinase [Methylotenera sp.]|nr:MAG: acetate kinase [Methylotenera sp.]